MKNFNITLLSICLLALSSCASLTSHKQEKEEIASIKTAAIVSFAVEQPASSQLSFDLGSKETSVEQGGGDIVGKNSPHAREIYEDLGQALQNNLKWKVKNYSEIVDHAGYKVAYTKTMKGWQNKMATPSGRNLFLAHNIMDADGMRILGFKGREQLLTDLGVDAIALAKVMVKYNGTTVMGIGQRRPQAAVMFQVFKKGKEDAIWFEGRVLGVESKQSVGATGFTDQVLLNKLTRESAQSAFEKLKIDSSTAKN